MEDTQSTEGQTPQENTAPSWFVDDGVAAPGQRPDWFPEKFKNVKSAIQSLGELEKRLGTPPVNDYDFGEHGNDFDKEHEAIKELTAFAKEKRVPQEVFSKMLDSMSKYGSSFIPDANAEKAKLGEKADQRIEVLNNWAKSNLSENSYNALVSGFATADTVIALEEIRNKMIGNNQIPTGSDGAAGNSTETIEQLQKELAAPGNFEKFKNDENYANNWRKRVAAASKNSSEWVDKQGY